VGTAVRTLGGLGLIYLAGAVDGLPWDVDWYDPVVGFVVLPLIMIAVGLGVRRYASRPIHLTGPVGIAINLAVIGGWCQMSTPLGEPFCSTAPPCSSPAWAGQPGARPRSSRTWCCVGRPNRLPTLFLIDDAEARMRRRETTAAR
jgi:hypothetical protein